jgi:type IV secretion system protein VirB6
MGVWIIGAAFFGGLNGFLLSIVSIIYCCMLLEVLFKFAHIFILSMFVLTILVLVSPIMVCFGLFNYTKSICSKWMSMILGYVLYPSLLFAFIALMLATFDSVYYGDLKLKSGQNAAFPEVVLACQNVDTIFCLTYKSLTNDPCKTPGEIVYTFSEIKRFALFGRFTLFRSAFIGPYLDAMLELMLFAFLFYLFMGSVTSFVAILTGVPDLSGMAAGAGAGFGTMVSMGKAAASGLSSAYSGIKSAFDGKK